MNHIAYPLTLTFMHLAHAFIQSDMCLTMCDPLGLPLNYRKAYHSNFLSLSFVKHSIVFYRNIQLSASCFLQWHRKLKPEKKGLPSVKTNSRNGWLTVYKIHLHLTEVGVHRLLFNFSAFAMFPRLIGQQIHADVCIRAALTTGEQVPMEPWVNRTVCKFLCKLHKKKN